MTLNKEKIFNLAARVSKPARYLGGEWNSCIKHDVPVRIGLCFPDLYEVGMSNNGMQILYHAVNVLPHACAERVFAVERDFEMVLKEARIPLYTLETYTPLAQLDMIGFNAACEMLYTNILQVLDLGNIPFYAKDRGDGYPLIIIAGEAMSNPAPVLPFADAVFVGDGDEAVIEMVNILIDKKKNNATKSDVLTRMASIEGVLCSRDVECIYEDKKLSALNAPAVYKRVCRKFNSFEAPRPVVPSIRCVQDRVSVQLDRGCKNLCKFCHAGYWELPYRKADAGDVAQAVMDTVKATGFADVSLHSLSVGDYSDIIELLNGIAPSLLSQGVSISLPSLRVDTQTIEIIESISDLKKTSLTFAVESASDALRCRAFKRLSEDEIMHIIAVLSQRGWQRIKLYFMIGLPGCTDVDEAADITAFMKRAVSINKKIQYNVTISPFVPKPHTPFQYEKQHDEQYCIDIIRQIKRSMPKNVTIKSHDVYASLIEGVFARGDSRLAGALVHAYESGARLDLWGEHFNFMLWDNSLVQTAGNWRRYLDSKDPQELSPWSMIKTSYESLIAKKMNSVWDGKKKPAGFKRNALNKEAFQLAARDFEKKYAVSSALRVQYAKKERARFIGHIDCMEIMKRALRIAGVPAAYTQGFNKHERLAAGPALPLGYESRSEFIDIEMYDRCDDAVLHELKHSFPDGFEIINAYHHGSATVPLGRIAFVRYMIYFSDSNYRTQFVNNLEGKKDIIKKTKKGLKNLRFDDAIVHYTADDAVELVMALGDGAIRPDRLIADWCGAEHPLAEATIVKTASYYLHEAVMAEFT